MARIGGRNLSDGSAIKVLSATRLAQIKLRNSSRRGFLVRVKALLLSPLEMVVKSCEGLL